jgi:TonB-linked SusC/RagA family outer membrane protein
MNLTTFFLLISLTSIATTGYSQSEKVTAQMQNASLKDFFKTIEKQTDYKFLYRDDVVENMLVNINESDKPLDDVLNKVLDGSNFSFKVMPNNLIVIASVDVLQQLTVTGTVTDENQNPMPGVNILIEGTTMGVISDMNGKYSINLQDGNSILVFSFIGYDPQKVPVAGKKIIDVSLVASLSTLDEVVVVGYGTQKKSDLTGSVMSVGSAQYQNQPITKLDQALQGRAAGVQVTQTSGQPGSTMKIRVRGANSISGSNEPLYILDGMAIEDIGFININDIASMEVLKDASATAIYGSRGANGVILITTKTGKKGRPTITFDSFYSSSTITKKLPMMNPYEYALGVNFLNGSQVYSDTELAYIQENGGVDWQAELFRTAPSFNSQLSFNGGNENIDYFISGSYNQAEGTIINQNYKRYTFRSNINIKLSEKIKIGLNISGAREETIGERANLANGLTFDPNTPIYNEEGLYNFLSLKGVGNGTINPIIAPNENLRDEFQNLVNASLYLDYRIIKNLVFNTSFGLNNNSGSVSSYIPIVVNGSGSAAVNITENVTMQNTNRFTYTTNIGIHHIQVDAIHEQQYYSNQTMNTTASQFFTDGTTYKNMALGAKQNIYNSSRSASLQSFLGRVNYSLADKYLFTGSFRADGSSKFREDNQWGYYPSASVAWRISQEEFMKGISQISNLKLRVSYGITGSQAIGPLATRSIPIVDPSVNYPFTGGTYTVGVAPSNRNANVDLTWEDTAQGNFGLDLGLWKGKVILAVDVYKKITSNLLLDKPLPRFVGPTIMAVNIGKVENKGFEVVLGFTPLQSSNWDISSTITLNRNKNTVLELVDDKPIEKGATWGDFPANPTRLEIGKAMGNFRGYQFLGVYQLGEEAEAAVYGRKPGYAKYADLSGPNGVPDGVISSDDITDVGDGNPDFSFGWNSAVRYKQVDLNFLVTGMVGNEMYNFQRSRMMSLGGAVFNASHADYLNRWTPTNPSNIPSVRDGTEALSSQFIEDGSYLNLKNVSLGYSFKNIEVFKTIGLNDLKIYGSIDNAFILTKYSGFDPEATASGNSDVDLGIDINTYPISRIYTFGVKLIF